MIFSVGPGYFYGGVRDKVRCALGRAGINYVNAKREGDGSTPCGRFPLRRVLYRADRIQRPMTGLPVQALTPADGWSDDPADPLYNRPVTLPHPYSHEALWRDDGLYDIIVVIGHNDDPVVLGHGSAVFIHVATPDYAPTEGCVALAAADLLELIENCRPGDSVSIVNVVLGDNDFGEEDL